MNNSRPPRTKNYRVPLNMTNSGMRRGCALLLLLCAGGLGSASADDDWNGRHGKDIVSIGHDSQLSAGHEAHSVVSILGTTTINGKVDADAVAVVGNVDLGPDAEIDGDVVAVLGSVRRDPAAIVRGDVHSILGGDFGSPNWLRSWITHCFLFGRPLALVSDLSWTWALALGFLAFYACLALLFPEGLRRCVATLEERPGNTLLAAIIAALLTPVLIVLLCVTIIGIAAVPFIATAILGAGLFGRAVILAWLGGRVTRSFAQAPQLHPAIAVLIGGAVVLVSYLVPVLGFLTYQLIGILGFGVVIYSLIGAARAQQTLRAVDGTATPAFGGAASINPSAASINAGAASPPSSASPVDPPLGDPPPSSASSMDSPLADPPPSQPPPPGARPSAAPSAAAPPVSAAMPRAGFWIRMAALFLDVLLVGFVTSVLLHVSHIQLVLLGVYGAVMWKLRGSTVGGIVFDLEVVRLDGRELQWETTIIRALACFLSLAVAGLGFIWIAFDDGRQAWHDKIAGTAVVRVPRPMPPA